MVAPVSFDTEEVRLVSAVPEVRYARSGEIDIAYTVLGDGPMDILFVPGFISHLDFNWEFPWFAWMTEWDGLARIITFDKRGTGLSDRSIGFGSLAERTDDIQAVMDAVGTERAALWGVSEGGPMSLLFAAQNPGRVSHLILYGSAARFLAGEGNPGGIDPALAPTTIDWMRNNWGTGFVYGMFIQNAPNIDSAIQALARFERNACTPHMMHEIMMANLTIDIREVLPTINVPTLVVHNVGDPMVPVELGRYLADHIPDARYIEGTGDFHGSWNGADLLWLVDGVMDFLGSRRSREAVDRVLATVLFTDIVGSTQRTAAVGDHQWRDLLDRHDRIASLEVDRFGGRIVNTTGDGLLATFDGPARGIRCAQAIRDGVRTLGLDLRAGVHTGEVETRSDDITGLGVVIARRVCDLATSGEVLASRTVKDLVTGSGIGFTDRGTHPLKGVPDEWQLFAIAG
jgi:class 3 adenylate cyclase